MCNFCDERPDLIPGKTNRPNTGSPNRWCGDPEDNFEPSERGYFGTLGRNTGIGPGLATVDFSILKNISMGETTRLQFRAEFFNVFNTPNFNQPNALFGTAGFGRVLSARAGREVQFGLKFLF